VQAEEERENKVNILNVREYYNKNIIHRNFLEINFEPLTL
jgi:hypothetical protein